MKVSKAKEKVCPFMSGQVAAGTEDIVFATVDCICGDCMAWKYTKDTYISNEDELGPAFKSYFDKEDCASFAGVEVERKELDEDEKEGYCKRLAE